MACTANVEASVASVYAVPHANDRPACSGDYQRIKSAISRKIHSSEDSYALRTVDRLSISYSILRW